MFSLACIEYNANKECMKIQRRMLRDSLDPFDMPEERFREMYRLPRSLALDFLNMVVSHMDGDPCTEVPRTIQFCAVLNFFASGSYQRRVGSDGMAMMSQTLVSRCVRAYSYVIGTKMVDEWIQFPKSVEEIEKLHDSMQEKHDFPGGFAIVDGSLICVAALSHEVEHVFMSRKQFHAINAQFVIDVSMRFLNVNARFGGSTHDSLIWRSSLVNAHLRRLHAEMGINWNFFLLADNGYPLQPWCLKPYDKPTTGAEKLYNKHHRKLRSLVERAIGLLKARFRCLLGERRLRYDPLMSGYIIYSCAVLHNFLIANNFPIDNIKPIFENDSRVFEDLHDFEINRGEFEGGAWIRNDVAEYFSSCN